MAFPPATGVGNVWITAGMRRAELPSSDRVVTRVRARVAWRDSGWGPLAEVMMVVELATVGGDVIQPVTEMERPRAGDLFQVDGKDWAVLHEPPRHRRETVPMGAGP